MNGTSKGYGKIKSGLVYMYYKSKKKREREREGYSRKKIWCVMTNNEIFPKLMKVTELKEEVSNK